MVDGTAILPVIQPIVVGRVLFSRAPVEHNIFFGTDTDCFSCNDARFCSARSWFNSGK